MSRVARERIEDLFGLASSESRSGGPILPDRYVRLARRVGTRYNVRLGAEHRELYCRGCSAFWVEGRTVRTRLRKGTRVLTCLRCGRLRRVIVRARQPRGEVPEALFRKEADLAGTAPVSDGSPEAMTVDEEEAEEL